VGLNYGGIDFGIDRDGGLLLFEANATMAILPPGADAKWDAARGGAGLPRRSCDADGPCGVR
jgi:glutathione synthase/RimK-type ligase-like ATP-grasp enzyme